MSTGNGNLRALGASGLMVTGIGYGAMGITHAYGDPLPKEEGIRIVRAAYDAGCNFFDTAEGYRGVYPDGTEAYNEEVVGEALKDVRDKAVIATKFGITRGNGVLLADSRPETIRRSLEGSLKRLGVETIDLYYQHRIDPKVDPETVAGTMADLIKEGKIRAWGVSEATADYLRRAHKVCPVAAVQNRYSLLSRAHEALFPTLEELNIAFVAFSPLANGFLTGKYSAASHFGGQTDFRTNMPQFSEKADEASRSLKKLLDELGAAKNATPGQISLAWMLCKKPYIAAIPGSRRPERIRENMGALSVKLTPEEIARIDELTDRIPVPVYGGIATK
jgi:aryl-alcohol dehydrogenase-like predicted oxidoreductase